MTAGFAGSSMAAGDVAWHAWNRLGVDVMGTVLGDERPEVLQPLAAAMAPELDRVTRLVLDELGVRLYGEARERVVDAVQRAMLHHSLWAVVEGIRKELTRPDPVPFMPPPAGWWIRARWIRSAREAVWHGRWHLFSGDIRRPIRRVNDVMGRTRCGVDVALRLSDWSSADHVAVADRPAIDACGTCLRLDSPAG
jgi:hypothetical protein